MAFASFSLHSAWVLADTLFWMARPVTGSMPWVYLPSQRPLGFLRILPSPLARFFAIYDPSFLTQTHTTEFLE